MYRYAMFKDSKRRPLYQTRHRPQLYMRTHKRHNRPRRNNKLRRKATSKEARSATKQLKKFLRRRRRCEDKGHYQLRSYRPHRGTRYRLRYQGAFPRLTKKDHIRPNNRTRNNPANNRNTRDQGSRYKSCQENRKTKGQEANLARLLCSKDGTRHWERSTGELGIPL